MSKTVRRKNGWDQPTYKFEYSDSLCACIKVHYDKSSLEFKQEKNKYHRDNHCNRGVPHHYININCERPLRKKSTQILKKWMKSPDFEPMVPLFRRDAGYFYW